MKKILWGIALSASLLSSAAMASVADYIKAGYSMDTVFAYARKDGLSPKETMKQALAAAPQQAQAIVALAVAADRSKAQEIVNEAVRAGVDTELAVTAALIGGADPSTVSAPTAAGIASLAAATPARAPNPLPAPSWSNAGGVGNGAGGGGGGIGASAN